MSTVDPDDAVVTLALSLARRAALYEAVARATEAQAHDELDFIDLDRSELLALRAELAPAWPDPVATTYTVSARKPASSDWCRGCHMADYPAGDRRIEGLTRAQAVEEIATIRLTQYGPGEARWSAVAFADGPLEDGLELYDIGTGFEDEVQAATLRLKLERDAQAVAKVADAQAKAADARRAADLAQLAALRAQYE